MEIDRCPRHHCLLPTVHCSPLLRSPAPLHLCFLPASRHSHPHSGRDRWRGGDDEPTVRNGAAKDPQYIFGPGAAVDQNGRWIGPGVCGWATRWTRPAADSSAPASISWGEEGLFMVVWCIGIFVYWFIGIVIIIPSFAGRVSICY